MQNFSALFDYLEFFSVVPAFQIHACVVTEDVKRYWKLKYAGHGLFASQNICGFENMANLEQLPPTGAYVVALPMKIKGGTGGPLRMVACISTDH